MARRTSDGEQEAARQLAYAEALQRARTASETPARYITDTGRVAWGASPQPFTRGGRIDARAPLSKQSSGGFTPQEDWNARFAPRTPVTQFAPTPAPEPPPLLKRPDETAPALAARAPVPGTVVQARPNELFQPTFRDASGDATHKILPRTPGEDKNLDPVYAANVFRAAGDEKTAKAYEGFAKTMDPTKFVQRGGQPWFNPHYTPAAAANGGPSDDPVQAVADRVHRTDVLSGVQPFDASKANGQPLQTFGGRTLNTDLASPAPAIAPVPRAPNASAVAAGQAVGGAIRAVNDVTSGGRGYTAAGLPIGAPEVRDTPIIDVPRVTGDFVSSVRGAISDFTGGAGKAIASGVSNSQSAGFTQPTKDNPVPVTPTTPVANPDRSDNSIARFGQSDEEWEKNKIAFSGF